MVNGIDGSEVFLMHVLCRKRYLTRQTSPSKTVTQLVNRSRYCWVFGTGCLCYPSAARRLSGSLNPSVSGAAYLDYDLTTTNLVVRARDTKHPSHGRAKYGRITYCVSSIQTATPCLAEKICAHVLRLYVRPDDVTRAMKLVGLWRIVSGLYIISDC